MNWIDMERLLFWLLWNEITCNSRHGSRCAIGGRNTTGPCRVVGDIRHIEDIRCARPCPLLRESSDRRSWNRNHRKVLMSLMMTMTMNSIEEAVTTATSRDRPDCEWSSSFPSCWIRVWWSLGCCPLNRPSPNGQKHFHSTWRASCDVTTAALDSNSSDSWFFFIGSDRNSSSSSSSEGGEHVRSVAGEEQDPAGSFSFLLVLYCCASDDVMPDAERERERESPASFFLSSFFFFLFFSLLLSSARALRTLLFGTRTAHGGGTKQQTRQGPTESSAYCQDQDMANLAVDDMLFADSKKKKTIDLGTLTRSD